MIEKLREEMLNQIYAVIDHSVQNLALLNKIDEDSCGKIKDLLKLSAEYGFDHGEIYGYIKCKEEMKNENK